MIALIFFFFKQKTAYEVRISDWSSDVCSSDLIARHLAVDPAVGAYRNAAGRLDQHPDAFLNPRAMLLPAVIFIATLALVIWQQIGRASCRERVCQYV